MPDAIILPPHSVESEEALLGALMVDPTAVDRVAGIVEPRDFYVVKNGWLYNAILDLRQGADILTVATWLSSRNLLVDAGGEGWIAQVAAGVPTALNVEEYAGVVADRAVRRRLISAASGVAKDAWDVSLPLESVVIRSGSAVEAASARRSGSGSVHVSALVPDFMAGLDSRRESPGEMSGHRTGIPELDAIMKGLRPGELVIVAARPGIGKTSLLLSMVDAVTVRGPRLPAAFYSLEMGKDQIMTRLISIRSRVDGAKIMTGAVSDAEHEAVLSAGMEIHSAPLFINDRSDHYWAERGGTIGADARTLVTSRGVQIVYLDYMGLVRVPASGLYEQMTVLARGLKNLARDLNVPLVAAAQLSRAVEQRAEKRPILSDLRDSGEIEQAADIVVFIYRDEYYNPNTEAKNIAEIAVAKNRNGPTGMANAFFDKRCTAFRPLSRERVTL